MNRVLIRRASLCLALLSPLFVTSCTSPTQGLPTFPTAQNCADCIFFNVKAWFFTPSPAGGLPDVLQSLQGISPSALKEGDRLRIISPSHDRTIPGIFSKHGRLDLIADASSVTTPGEPISVSTKLPSGVFTTVLNPLPASGKRPLNIVSYEISANLPEGGFAIPVNKVFNSGRILLRNGESLLLIQQVKDEYVVWLVRASFSPGLIFPLSTTAVTKSGLSLTGQ